MALSLSVYIHTFGCQMNVHDSARVRSLLRAAGYDFVDDPESADILLMNTCSVRAKAADKAKSLLGMFISRKRSGRASVVGVMGCLAVHEAKELSDKYPELDIVIGPAQEGEIADYISAAMGGEKVVDVSHRPEQATPFPVSSAAADGKVSVEVSIMHGCDNACAYCIVPRLRGRQVSRPSADIIEEVERLVDQGVKEVVLLGQNVNTYGRDSGGDVSFPVLLDMVNEIHGLRRIRFVTSHPRDLSDELIERFGSLEKLCPHIHLPVQSGSDRILGLMNRGYTVSHYLDRVESLRDVRPDIEFSTDIIVGFPGETEEDFNQTVDLIKKVKFAQIYAFVFSPRRGTRAANMGFGPEDRRRGLFRLSKLFEIQREILLAGGGRFVGKSVEVLVDRSEGDAKSGRTPCNRLVHFSSDFVKQGDIVSVQIVEARPHCLIGEEVS